MFTRKIVVCEGYDRRSLDIRVNTGEHVKMLDSNTKIDLSSRLINRFQKFLVFQKAERLLFPLQTTAWWHFDFRGEKNNIL